MIVKPNNQHVYFVAVDEDEEFELTAVGMVEYCEGGKLFLDQQLPKANDTRFFVETEEEAKNILKDVLEYFNYSCKNIHEYHDYPKPQCVFVIKRFNGSMEEAVKLTQDFLQMYESLEHLKQSVKENTVCSATFEQFDIS